MDAPRMRWWGWGADGHDRPLPVPAVALLRDELGVDPGRRRPPVALDDVQLAPSRLPSRARALLEEIVGAEHVRDDHLTRVAHAAGRSFSDLVRLRSGRGLAGPDAVVLPAGRKQVERVVRACAQERVAVVPFGGGTSVVGGVEPLRGPFESVVSVDLARLHGLVGLDVRSQLATFAAGTPGPDVERLLAPHGLTLGHLPQSFEFSTVGGWAATRSAGQASTGYGRIDELVVALRAATPSGEIATAQVPASAAGPSLRQLLLGSEGVLGVITDVTLRVRPRPARRRWAAWSLPDFAAGCEALRELEQRGAAPDVARLSDEQETRLSLLLASRPAAARVLRGLLRARGRRPGCLAIAGFDGEPAEIARRHRRTAANLRRHGAIALGRAPAAGWAKGRFDGGYVRDELVGRGVLVETLETATTWTGLAELHEAVTAALRGALAGLGTPPLVGCHVSHLYATGASLYFTSLARARAGEELDQWRAAKYAATEAISAAGATVTHHHAVGRDHAPWLTREVGERGIDALRALKAQLDPDGIMNPGKLVPAPAA